MTDYEGHHPEYEKIPYPQVGDKNPTVKIGVINIENKQQQWMDIPDKGYIPRLYWTSEEGQLAIVHLNRAQNHLRLFFNDVSNGRSKLIMEEQSDDGWIDVFNFFAGVDHMFYFPDNSKEFFWISDRDGWSHIYRYDYKGNVKNQVTRGNWEVSKVNAIDYANNRIYYTSTETSPLQRQLFPFGSTVLTNNGLHRKKAPIISVWDLTVSSISIGIPAPPYQR